MKTSSVVQKGGLSSNFIFILFVPISDVKQFTNGKTSQMKWSILVLSLVLLCPSLLWWLLILPHSDWLDTSIIWISKLLFRLCLIILGYIFKFLSSILRWWTLIRHYILIMLKLLMKVLISNIYKYGQLRTEQLVIYLDL